MASSVVATQIQAQSKGLSLDELSDYLNGLKNAQSDFKQQNSNGSRSEGKFYLKRPGRMRFEYFGRDAALVVAGQKKLAVFDRKSNAGPQQYPLRRTPLHIILRERVDLAKSGMILGHELADQETIITAHDPKHPEMGQVEMVFLANPTRLSKWIVTDEAGRMTKVVLGELDTETRVPARLFDIAALIKSKGEDR